MGASDKAHDQSGDDGHQAGGDQFLQSAGGGDVNTFSVVRLHAFLSFLQSRNGVELAVNLRYHPLGVFIHAQNQHGGEYGGYAGADENAEKYGGFHDIKAGDQFLARRLQGHVGLRHEGSQQGDHRQSGGADGKALGHGFYRVAGAVQLIRRADGVFPEAAHLRQSSGVVHDGTVGVIGDNHAYNGKHAYRRHGDAEDGVALAHGGAQLIGDQGGDGNAHHGGKRGDKAVGNAGEHREGGTGFGSFRHPLYNGFGIVRKIVGGNSDNHAHDQSRGGRSPDAPGEAVKNGGGNGGEHQENTGGHIGGGVEGVGGISVFADFGCGDSDDGGQQSQNGVAEYHGSIGESAACQGFRDYQGGCHGGHVGVKQVRAHAGHIAHVVAYVVGDYGRVAGVILGDAQFHFSGQVRGDVGSLGKDAAAGLGEEGQGAGAEGEAQKNGGVAGDHQHGGYAQKRTSHYQQAHHGAAPEADEEGGLNALSGALRGPGVGVGGHHNADLAGDGGKGSSKQIGHCHGQVL